MAHSYIALTILLTVYGQIVIKWQVGLARSLPNEFTEKILFLFKLLLNPWIISSFAGAFLAALSWIATMSKFLLSYAYPLMSLAFVLVLFLSAFIFDKPVNLPKVIGMGLIVMRLVVGSQG